MDDILRVLGYPIGMVLGVDGMMVYLGSMGTFTGVISGAVGIFGFWLVGYTEKLNHFP